MKPLSAKDQRTMDRWKCLCIPGYVISILVVRGFAFAPGFHPYEWAAFGVGLLIATFFWGYLYFVTRLWYTNPKLATAINVTVGTLAIARGIHNKNQMAAMHEAQRQQHNAEALARYQAEQNAEAVRQALQNGTWNG
jgi:hypothetical protein